MASPNRGGLFIFSFSSNILLDLPWWRTTDVHPSSSSSSSSSYAMRNADCLVVIVHWIYVVLFLFFSAAGMWWLWTYIPISFNTTLIYTSLYNRPTSSHKTTIVQYSRVSLLAVSLHHTRNGNIIQHFLKRAYASRRQSPDPFAPNCRLTPPFLLSQQPKAPNKDSNRATVNNTGTRAIVGIHTPSFLLIFVRGDWKRRVDFFDTAIVCVCVCVCLFWDRQVDDRVQTLYRVEAVKTTLYILPFSLTSF